MKRILTKSFAIALIITASGFLTNLISYFIHGSLVFCRTLYGGEWIGYSGFGLLVNHTFPMTTPDDPVASGSTWLEFYPSSLIAPLIITFLIAFAVVFVLERVVWARR